MTDSFQFRGIYTPLVTPFDNHGKICFETLADLIEDLITCGVHGVISGGSTGENYALTIDERIEVARFTHACVRRRVPVVVGTGAMLTTDSLALATAARAMCADAILLASPPYAVPTDSENAKNALAIDAAAGLPVMLYNYPHRTGTMMGRMFLDIVTRHPNFCGIKESSGDINRLHLLANDYPQIQLGCGMDDQALEFFAWGAPFWVCGGSNFLPREHIALHHACMIDGDFARGRRIMSALMPLMNALEQGGKFIQTIKYGVTVNGRNAGGVRPPLDGLTDDERAGLDAIMSDIKGAFAAMSENAA
jgi:4-hydroxy-tetrahydrodipicolinate synthase